MLKRIAMILVALAIVIAMFAFTSVNTGTIRVDLLFIEVTTSVPVAFTVAFAVGWVFGVLCVSVWIFRLLNERRILKRALHASESEVSSLRSLPLTDAD